VIWGRRKQLVDETVLAPAQAQGIEAGRRQQVVRVAASGMRRCKYDGNRLPERAQHHDRRGRSKRGSDWHVHGCLSNPRQSALSRPKLAQISRDAYFFRRMGA
jgi:hypothetical protein